MVRTRWWWSRWWLWGCGCEGEVMGRVGQEADGGGSEGGVEGVGVSDRDWRVIGNQHTQNITPDLDK